MERVFSHIIHASILADQSVSRGEAYISYYLISPGQNTPLFWLLIRQTCVQKTVLPLMGEYQQASRHKSGLCSQR